VLVVRKLGTPGQPELAMGAVASGGIRVLNHELIDLLGLTRQDVERVAANEIREVERRERAYRGQRPPAAVKGRTVILIDDGVATGSTVLAALVALRRMQPQKLIAAFPVGAAETVLALATHADQVVCLEKPQQFEALSLWYYDFEQVSDQEVRALLQSAASAGARRSA
jgi:predicted phosphoribosyltransferase